MMEVMGGGGPCQHFSSFSLLNLIGFIIRLLPPLQFKSLSVSLFSLNPIKEIYHFYHHTVIIVGRGRFVGAEAWGMEGTVKD